MAYFVEVDGAVTIKKIVPLMSEWLQCHVLSKRNQFADNICLCSFILFIKIDEMYIGD